MKSIGTEYKELKGIQITTVVFILLRTLFSLISVYLIQNLLDDVILKNYDKVFYLVKFFILIIIIYFLLLFCSQYFLRKLFFLGNFSILKFLYFNFLNRDFKDFRNFNSADILSKLTMDSTKVSDWYSQGKVILSTQIIILLSVLCFMGKYNFIIMIILFCLIFFCFFIVKKLSSKLSELMKTEQSLLSETNQYIAQSIVGLFDLKQLNKEEYFINYLTKKIIDKRITVNTSIARYFSLYVGVSSTVAFILPIISILLSVYFLIYYNFSIGSAIAIYTTVRMLNEPINAISNQITIRQTAKKIENNLYELFVKSESEENNKFLTDFDNLYVNIENFYYDEKKILSNIEFNINKGELLVIKGKSGIGKTTITNIILKILTEGTFNFQGEVLWNGINIYEENIKLLGNVLKVNQEPYIYETNIKENILLGDNLEDRFNEIINTLHLTDLINKLGDNYCANENGKNLSGGEKQRIELARILIRRPQFIILDEPTSAMNKNLSEEIVGNIYNYLKKYNITCLVITHSVEFDKYSDKELLL